MNLTTFKGFNSLIYGDPFWMVATADLIKYLKFLEDKKFKTKQDIWEMNFIKNKFKKSNILWKKKI